MNAIQFTTPVNFPKAAFQLHHQTPILLIGSCFTVSIGQKLLTNKFDVSLNPNGIIYNPISVFNTLQRIINNQLYTENELLQVNGKWVSLDYHGSFSSFNKKECLSNINQSLTQAHQKLLTAKTIIITFGSAWVYNYANKKIVANCHKIPAKEFKKRLLTVKEILAAFDTIKAVTEHLNILFTISPVRHINDGLHENNLSKAVLHLAINNLVVQNKNCSYFPAYEIVIDELRDYRFFKDDLIHPTELAVNYVWKKFVHCFFDDNTKMLITEIEKIKAATNHRPFNFDSETHQKFIKKQIQLMDKLSTQFPFLDFEEEKVNFKGK